MLNINIIILFIAGLMIMLGFVALVTQKIYMDAATQQPIEISVPLVGKMKTNYPALVFVLLGVYLVIHIYPPQKTQWTILGELRSGHQIIDWQKGTLTLVPTNVRPGIAKTGHFSIQVDIEEDKIFEESFQVLDYSHPDFGSKLIYLKKEHEKYQDEKTRESSLIEAETENTRKYKAISLTWFPQPKGE